MSTAVDEIAEHIRNGVDGVDKAHDALCNREVLVDFAAEKVSSGMVRHLLPYSLLSVIISDRPSERFQTA